MTQSDVKAVDKFLDDWHLRLLEFHRQVEMEGWSDGSVKTFSGRDWHEDPTVISVPWVDGSPTDEDRELAAQIKARVMSRLKETK